MGYGFSDSLYARIRYHILDFESETWVYGRLLYGASSCGCYFRLGKDGAITICVRSKQADRYFKLKAWSNQAQYTELPQQTKLPETAQPTANAKEVEAFKYPFSKGFTFLPRFIDN